MEELEEIKGLAYNPTLDKFFSGIEKHLDQKTSYLIITVGYLLLFKSERVTNCILYENLVLNLNII